MGLSGFLEVSLIAGIRLYKFVVSNIHLILFWDTTINPGCSQFKEVLFVLADSALPIMVKPQSRAYWAYCRPGAHERPKATKERATCEYSRVSFKYKSVVEA